MHNSRVLTLAACSGKRNVNGLASIRLSQHIHHDSPGGSMRRGHRTFWSNYKEDRYTCSRTFNNATRLTNLALHLKQQVQSERERVKYLVCIHNCANSNSQCLIWNFGQITIKEPGIGLDSFNGQRLHSCP